MGSLRGYAGAMLVRTCRGHDLTTSLEYFTFMLQQKPELEWKNRYEPPKPEKYTSARGDVKGNELGMYSALMLTAHTLSKPLKSMSAVPRKQVGRHQTHYFKMKATNYVNKQIQLLLKVFFLQVAHLLSPTRKIAPHSMANIYSQSTLSGCNRIWIIC